MQPGNLSSIYVDIRYAINPLFRALAFRLGVISRSTLGIFHSSFKSDTYPNIHSAVAPVKILIKHLFHQLLNLKPFTL